MLLPTWKIVNINHLAIGIYHILYLYIFGGDQLNMYVIFYILYYCITKDNSLNKF